MDTKNSFGTLDIVCNNAGILDEDNWELAIDVNLVRLRTLLHTYEIQCSSEDTLSYHTKILLELI